MSAQMPPDDAPRPDKSRPDKSRPDLTPEQLDEVLAAELALGLISGEEAAQVVARLGSEPQFARRVREWQERLVGFADELTPVMPPSRARQQIREELGHRAPTLSQEIEAAPHWWQRPLVWLVIAISLIGIAISIL